LAGIDLLHFQETMDLQDLAIKLKEKKLQFFPETKFGNKRLMALKPCVYYVFEQLDN
jgi:hypothetical protein